MRATTYLHPWFESPPLQGSKVASSTQYVTFLLGGESGRVVDILECNIMVYTIPTI